MTGELKPVLHGVTGRKGRYSCMLNSVVRSGLQEALFWPKNGVRNDCLYKFQKFSRGGGGHTPLAYTHTTNLIIPNLMATVL